MLDGIQHMHNFLRWLVILFAVWTLISSMGGLSGAKTFTKVHKRPALLLMIMVDLQLLLGLVLYFSKGWFKVLTSGGFMGKDAQRFWAMEHFVGMLLGVIFIHMGYSAIKKNISDKSKFSRVFWFTLIGLLIILVTIPWPFREVVGRPLFPGM